MLRRQHALRLRQQGRGSGGREDGVEEDEEQHDDEDEAEPPLPPLDRATADALAAPATPSFGAGADLVGAAILLLRPPTPGLAPADEPLFFIPLRGDGVSGFAELEPSERLLADLLAPGPAPPGEPPTRVIAFRGQEIMRVLLLRGTLPLAGAAATVCLLDPVLMAFLAVPDRATYDLPSLAASAGLAAAAPGVPSSYPLARLRADLFLTCALADHLASPAAGLAPEIVLRELRVASLLAEQEARGIGMQATALASAASAIRARRRQLQLDANLSAGVSFNLASSAQTAQTLYGHLGLTPPNQSASLGRQRTVAQRLLAGEASPKTMHASADERALRALAEQHPLPGILLEFRAMSKMLSTWIKPLLAASAGPRLRARFHQTQAETGRLSSSNPNLQAVPKFSLRQGGPDAASAAGPAAIARAPGGGPADSDPSGLVINIRDALVARDGCQLLSAGAEIKGHARSSLRAKPLRRPGGSLLA